MRQKYYKKYNGSKKKKTKITIKKLIKEFSCFCIGYTIAYFVASILGLISKISDATFFRWCKIISDFLSLPTSKADFLIMVFGLHWLFVILGIIFVIRKLHDESRFIR